MEGIHEKREKEGRLNSMDTQFLNKAEPIVYGMLSVALHIKYEDVDSFIKKRISK